jgi:hypothetical protein
MPNTMNRRIDMMFGDIASAGPIHEPARKTAQSKPRSRARRRERATRLRS